MTYASQAAVPRSFAAFAGRRKIPPPIVIVTMLAASSRTPSDFWRARSASIPPMLRFAADPASLNSPPKGTVGYANVAGKVSSEYFPRRNTHYRPEEGNDSYDAFLAC